MCALANATGARGGLSDVQSQQMRTPHMLVMLYGMKKGEIFLGPFSTRFFTPSWNTVSPCTGKVQAKSCERSKVITLINLDCVKGHRCLLHRDPCASQCEPTATMVCTGTHQQSEQSHSRHLHSDLW